MFPEIILGPPGTGKTSALLEEVEKAFSTGVEPQRVGFFSFTKQAVNVAKERAIAKFGLRENDLPYFRTLHSLAFKQLALTTGLVMGPKQYREIGEALGLQLSGAVEPIVGTILQRNKDDGYPQAEQYSRVTLKPLEEAYDKFNDDHLHLPKLIQFQKYLIKYKQATQFLDFTDMLSRYIRDCEPPELDLLLIDEAQDLSALQWEVVKFLATGSKRTIVAGDDDQAIYEWSGADVQQFIQLKGDERVLNKSHRLSQTVHYMATEVLTDISDRREKVFHPRAYRGVVHYEDYLEDIDMSKGRWLILARENYQINRVKESLHDRRMLFEHKGASPIDKKSPYLDDKIYLRTCLAAGEDLEKPRIEVSTIHGAKGRECDNVVLLTDISRRVWENMQDHPDEENRVLYVGLTRAKNELYLISPKTRYSFGL